MSLSNIRQNYMTSAVTTHNLNVVKMLLQHL